MSDYDVIPYESLPLSDAFPGKLAVLGRIFGIETAEPAHCRILELGCAEGGNLIPLAWHNPNSTYVGIDLSAKQIETGQDTITKLGLDNITLVQADLLDLHHEYGEFDYIIAHGVYSWVPMAVRDKLLTICRDSLAANGLAYISYNINPGWRVRGALRDMLLHHVRGETEPRKRLEQAYQFIAVLNQAMRPGSALERYFKEELTHFKIAHPSYIYHEYLEIHNSPLQFSEFLTDIEQHDLRYVCDTDLYTMFSSVFEPEVEHFLEDLGSLEEQEQYMDFLRVRTLRQSLVCRRSIEPEYNIDLSCLDNFACYSELKPQKQINLRRQSEDIFFAQEKRVPISDPVIKATLMHLSEVHPDAVAIPELYALAQARMQTAEVRRGVTEYADWQKNIFNLFANNLIGLYPAQRHFPRTTTQLQLSPLARLQAGTGNITTAWHQNLTLDAFAIRLVELLDGGRSMDEVVMLLKQDGDSGRLDLGPHPSIDAIKKNCNRLLALFQHHGLMCAGGAFVAETA